MRFFRWNLVAVAVLSACSGTPDAKRDPQGASGGSGGGTSGGTDGLAGGSSSVGGAGGTSQNNTTGGTSDGGSSGQSAGGSTNGGSGADGGGGGSGPFVPPTCEENNTAPHENAPTLSTSMWTEISPSDLTFGGGKNLTQGIALDPCNPNVLYVCICRGGGDYTRGLYRTTDAGATWTNLHPFESCVNVRVDPADPMHLYVGDGVAGGTHGFWVSTDGGENWARPDGFNAIAATVGTDDVYHVDPNPADFNHVLVSFHSEWNSGNGSGAVESTDGGQTFVKSNNTGGTYAPGYDVYFLYDPVHGVGNSSTWLFGTQGDGHYRTTDSGQTWTKVTDVSMEHGGGQLYYADNGTVYLSSAEGVIKSTNNGESWTKIGPAVAALSMTSDGTTLYTGWHGGGPFKVAPLSNDTNWTDFNGQNFEEGPFQMAIDSANGVLYSGNIIGGVWALKL
jgi:hypothetical protein